MLLVLYVNDWEPRTTVVEKLSRGGHQKTQVAPHLVQSVGPLNLHPSVASGRRPEERPNFPATSLPLLGLKLGPVFARGKIQSRRVALLSRARACQGGP